MPRSIQLSVCFGIRYNHSGDELGQATCPNPSRRSASNEPPLFLRRRHCGTAHAVVGVHSSCRSDDGSSRLHERNIETETVRCQFGERLIRTAAAQGNEDTHRPVDGRARHRFYCGFVGHRELTVYWSITRW